MKCPLCGHRFEEGKASSCESCPLGRSCQERVCCPNCGYVFPQSSSIIDFMKKLARKIGVRR